MKDLINEERGKKLRLICMYIQFHENFLSPVSEEASNLHSGSTCRLSADYCTKFVSFVLQSLQNKKDNKTADFPTSLDLSGDA